MEHNSRGIAWRRHKMEIHIKRRMSISMQISFNWFKYKFKNVNNIPIESPVLIDYLNMPSYFINKTYYTTKWTSRYKRKYSNSRSKGVYYNDSNNRVSKKREFRKMLMNIEDNSI